MKIPLYNQCFFWIVQGIFLLDIDGYHRSFAISENIVILRYYQGHIHRGCS